MEIDKNKDNSCDTSEDQLIILENAEFINKFCKNIDQRVLDNLDNNTKAKLRESVSHLKQLMQLDNDPVDEEHKISFNSNNESNTNKTK